MASGAFVILDTRSIARRSWSRPHSELSLFCTGSRPLDVDALWTAARLDLEERDAGRNRDI